MATEITKVGALNLQACSDEQNMGKLAAEVNRLNMCGTANGWVLSDRPGVAPVKCDSKPGFKHYIFDC